VDERVSLGSVDELEVLSAWLAKDGLWGHLLYLKKLIELRKYLKCNPVKLSDLAVVV
jgi:hypothetical protein